MEWCEWVNVTFNNLVIPWNGVNGLMSHLQSTYSMVWCRWANVTFNNLIIPWNGVNGLMSHSTI
jgi:hypothetical protein